MGNLELSVARLPLGSELRLDFPTTPNPVMDSRVRQHLRWACDYIIQYLGAENIRAIVLSGSLAVGEGSAFLNANGDMKLLSDMDILIVANESSWADMEEESPYARFRAKNNELNYALNLASPPELLNPIDTAIVTPETIRISWAKPTIKKLQLSGATRVLWGDKDIFPVIPPVSQEEITDEDVFRLFNNRIAEQVFYFVRYKQGLDGPECFVYHSTKAAVDTVLAVCAATRCCKPRLLDRLDIFKNLCRDTQLGQDIAEWAEFWTRYKLAPDLAVVAERFSTQNIETGALAAWDEVADFMLRGLRWSARTRLGFDEARDRPQGSVSTFVMQLARHFGFPGPPRFSLKVLMFHPRTFLRHLRGYLKSPSNLFAEELRRANLPVPGSDRTKKLSAWGSAKSLMYSAATLLLAARGESEIEQMQLLQTASDILPVVEPFTCADAAEWWGDLAVETARLWNILIMDGRR